MIALLTMMSPALAQHASEPRSLLFTDDVPILTPVAVDTGWWPSASSPVAVKFSIVPSGGVVTELQAESHLEWDELGASGDPMLHHITGFAGGGWFGLDAELDISTEVQLNILAVFTGIVPLGSRTIRLSDGVSFDGVLLPESAIESVSVSSVGAPVPLSYEIEVIPGVSLSLGANVFPELEASLVGVEVRTDAQGTESLQMAEEHWVELPPDPGRLAELGMATTWSGQLDAAVDLVIEPTVVVDTWLGPFTLAQVDIPVLLGEGSELRELGPTFYSHPLPVLEIDRSPMAFGDVPLGDLATVELPLENLGKLQLTGTVEVLGDPGFRVFPEAITAEALASDGLVVTFEPTQLGMADGVVVLHTNDPIDPMVQIVLSGAGFDSVDREPQRVNGEEVRGGGCACDQVPARQGVWGLLARRR